MHVEIEGDTLDKKSDEKDERKGIEPSKALFGHESLYLVRTSHAHPAFLFHSI